MNLSEFFHAASAAWMLLAANPVRWLCVVVIFLVAVESLMFIPYVGFVLKLAVAGVVSAQLISMFASAAAGQKPSPLDLFSAFSVPPTAQAALAFAAILPFAVAMVFLYLKAGPTAIEFFFGNILKLKPPPKELFMQSKVIMQLVAVPFTLLAGAVALKGLSGMNALSTAITAGASNWLPLVLIGLLVMAFEWLSVQLPQFLPKPAAVAVGGILLVLFLSWSFAVMYTVSAKVFGVAAVKNAG